MSSDAANAVSAFTLQVCTPLVWHDKQRSFPKEVEGASCFILRFSDRLVGVTAAHVLEAYKLALQRVPTLVCQLRLMPFQLNDAIIDWDFELDIATFHLSEAELSKINGVPIDCREQWPPPKPAGQSHLSLAGFPEEQREIRADRSAIFNAYGALATVEDISERDILLTYDRRSVQSMGTTPLPPPLASPPAARLAYCRQLFP